MIRKDEEGSMKEETGTRAAYFVMMSSFHFHPSSFSSLLPKFLRQIPVAAIWKHRHNQTPFDLHRHFQRGHHGGTRRNAHQQPFLARQSFGHLLGFLRAHPNRFRRKFWIEDTGNDGALHVFEPFKAVERAVGLHRDDLDIRVELAEPPSRSHQRPGGAEPRDEWRTFP